MKKIIGLILLCAISLCTSAQISKDIKWTEKYVDLCLIMGFELNYDQVEKIDDQYSKFTNVELILDYKVYTTYTFYRSALCSIDMAFHEVIGTDDEKLFRANIIQILNKKYKTPIVISDRKVAKFKYATENSNIVFIHGTEGWSRGMKITYRPIVPIEPSLKSQLSNIL